MRRPPLYQTLHSHKPLNSGSTDKDFDEFCLLMLAVTEAEQLSEAKVLEDAIRFGVPARIEFFRQYTTSHKTEQRRGANLFDNHGELICHVHNALLGYEGSAPQLSKDIMGWLGIPLADIDKIKQLAGGSEYFIVVSREQTMREQDIECVRPFAKVKDQWSYWRIGR